MRGKTYLSNENIYDDFLNSLHARKLAISSLHSDECEDLSLYQLAKLIKMKKNLRPDFIVINRQVNNAFTKILCTMSKDLHIPLILVDEIMPEKYDCVLLWQINQLLEINTALQKN
jgi:hypothetical protein